MDLGLTERVCISRKTVGKVEVHAATSIHREMKFKSIKLEIKVNY